MRHCLRTSHDVQGPIRGKLPDAQFQPMGAPRSIGLVALPSVMEAAEALTYVVRRVSKDEVHLRVSDDRVQKIEGVSMHHSGPFGLVREFR